MISRRRGDREALFCAVLCDAGTPSVGGAGYRFGMVLGMRFGGN